MFVFVSILNGIQREYTGNHRQLDIIHRRVFELCMMEEYLLYFQPNRLRSNGMKDLNGNLMANSSSDSYFAKHVGLQCCTILYGGI